MIALVNCSPKPLMSAAGEMVKRLDERLLGTARIDIKGGAPKEDVIRTMLGCRAIIFSFPLYVDGIPSHLLRWLEMMAQTPHEGRPRVYCVVNCGFYEGEQGALALDMMKNFCRKSGLIYSGGVSIGSGGVLPYISYMPSFAPPRIKIERITEVICSAAASGESYEDAFLSAGGTRWLYKLIAETSFKRIAKNNGASLMGRKHRSKPR